MQGWSALQAGYPGCSPEACTQATGSTRSRLISTGSQTIAMATNRASLARASSLAPVVAAPVRRQNAHVQLIQQSHERCAALGLTRIERPDYEPLMRSDLTVARERNRRLYRHAAPVMEMLFEQIVNTESMIVLTDAHGTILHSVGDDDFLERAGKVALTPGVNWAEHSKGTNAIGTALFEERPTLVHADEHFMHANHFLTCSAVPIYDPRGSMLGVLDVTGDHRSYHQHTMGLVRMSASMIENHWLCDDYGNRLRLHFHSRPEFIGTLLEGIVVVGGDGKILGANRSALDQLALTGAAVRAHSLGTLFGTSVSAVHDHFRTPLPVPMQVALPTGPRFYLSARSDWGMGVHLGAAPPTPLSQPDSTALQAEPARVPADPLNSAATAGLSFLLTGDAQVEAVVNKARRILDHDISLLIVGEAGTGKEILARAMHQESNRARQQFVTINCALRPEALLESELFGRADETQPGSRRKAAVGRIVQAGGGTLFLDQVDALPLTLQARLLRVLQERCVHTESSSKSIAIDVAIIAATRSSLRDLIAQQAFLEDLYYRLNGLVLRLPALRERTDLAALAKRILQVEGPRGTAQVAPALLTLLRKYPWPGNIRQLAGALRTAAVMSAGEPQITEAHLSDDLLEDIHIIAQAQGAGLAQREGMGARNENLGPADASAGPGQPLLGLVSTLEQAEIELIRNALAACQGNISEASKRLGISRNTIYRKLRWNKPA